MKKNKAKLVKKSVKSKVPFTPLGDRVLVQEILGSNKSEKTDSGIYLPETAKEDKGAKKGKVIAVGAGHYDDGVLIPVSVKIGDTVLYQWGDAFSYQGEEYVILRESEIIGVIK
jgi:chaperonin GroES